MDGHAEGIAGVTPSVGQIRAQVSALLEHDAQARAIGIFASSPATWPQEVAIGDRRFALRWCASPLAVRLALREARRNGSGGTIVLTPLLEGELGADVLARLSRGRVFRVKQWEIVPAAFQARMADTRLGEHGWMADLLIERMPANGYAPAPSGVLDAETAWRALLQVTLGLQSARPDLESLLEWTTRPDAMERWRGLSEIAQAGIAEWLERVTGPAGQLVVGALAGGHGTDALPLGLVADVLCAEGGTNPEREAAAVRLEPFMSGRRFDQAGGARWAAAAGRVIRGLGDEAARPWLARADQLVEQLHLAAHAGLSTLIPTGFEARLAQYGHRLERFLAGAEADALRDLDTKQRACVAMR